MGWAFERQPNDPCALQSFQRHGAYHRAVARRGAPPNHCMHRPGCVGEEGSALAAHAASECHRSGIRHAAVRSHTRANAPREGQGVATIVMLISFFKATLNLFLFRISSDNTRNKHRMPPWCAPHTASLLACKAAAGPCIVSDHISYQQDQIISAYVFSSPCPCPAFLLACPLRVPPSWARVPRRSRTLTSSSEMIRLRHRSARFSPP